ncbi:uncharacterized protein ALTATR162_LOCUS5 [Alternaria atra]|uniref:Uncharacterized protein n=1 Tax=Alternaria atra TaxID=119953 RepID=A0A8J2HQQ1_9PLEO|nr:uncharacterized protein ALTATR162_LOCUS5 [Alternaria atra]CAG5136911.1 unnamed protein product [Alternaria atra]
MTDSTVTTWTPTSEAEIKAKEAFESLSESVDRIVSRNAVGEPARFILNSKGYFAVKDYAETGKSFPTTDEEFEKQISKSAFHKLTDADPDIYATTRKTMVNIGSSCSDFAKNHLTSLISCAQDAIQYSDNATTWLSGMDNVNLRSQLEILFNEKYTSKDTQDDAYRNALEIANASLNVLKSEALEKKEATKKVLEALLRFQNETISNHSDMEYLVTQYETGPVKANSITSDPFLKYLNADLQEKKNSLLGLITEQNDKYEAWQIHTGVACGSVVVPIIGWISMAVNTGFAIARRNEYEELVKQVNKAKTDNQEETDLIEYVSKMVTQGKGIEKKMEAAVAAMQELHDLFSNQSECFDKVATYLSGMQAGVKLDSLTSRKLFVMNSMTSALKKLKDLKQVAQEFVTNAVHSIDLTKKE